MNLRARFPGKGRTPGALADIARVQGLWAETRERFGAGGPYLFGARFGMADAMYAPVVARFVTWQPELTPATKAYVDAIWSHPWMKEWIAAAEAEPWHLAKYDTPPD
jgi:glutathione S-transferase